MPADMIQFVNVNGVLQQISLSDLIRQCPDAHELRDYKVPTWLPPCWRAVNWVENIEDAGIQQAAREARAG